MGARYKVWIEVEEHDEETDKSCDIDLGFASTAVFDTVEEAIEFATNMHYQAGGHIHEG